jgi:hypothetical protein
MYHPKINSSELDILVPIQLRTHCIAFLKKLAIVHSMEPGAPLFRNQANHYPFCCHL